MGSRKYSIQLGGIYTATAPIFSRDIGGIGIDISIVFIFRGTSHGLRPTLEKGGAIHILGGSAAASNGRKLNLMSGMSGAGYSGEVLIPTSDDDINGLNSSNIYLGTGFDVDRIYVTIKLISGNYLLGPGSYVNIAVG